MPAIEIRPALEKDISILLGLDHHSTSDFVWQIESQSKRSEEQVTVNFRQVRLPRSAKIEYPRPFRTLATNWRERSGVLVSLLAGQAVGYICLELQSIPPTTWVTDLVVDRSFRRKGIGSALLIAAMEWANQMESQNLALEMQPKNYPAIQMAQKLGFEFSGFIDRYYGNDQTALFFRKSVY